MPVTPPRPWSDRRPSDGADNADVLTVGNARRRRRRAVLLAVPLLLTCDSDRLRQTAVCGDACYTGPTATRNVGACRDGATWCGPGDVVECVGQVHPTPEACDGIDSDCDGVTPSSEVDVDGDAHPACRDCDDADPLAHPGQSETCNGVDDNCDGNTDEHQVIIYCYSGPAGTATVGACHPGAVVCRDSRWTGCEHEAVPRTEVCDGMDNDCDGEVDEGFAQTVLDVFERPAAPMVDVLFVVDNSGSMMEEQAGLAAGFAYFVAAIAGWDYHLAVTTTGIRASGGCPGGADGGEAGRLFPVDGAPRIITPQVADPVAAFARNVAVGLCHWWEEGLEAAFLATIPPLVDSADDPRTTQLLDGNLGFLRKDARLSIVYVSDENDYSPRPVQEYIDHIKGLKPGRQELLSVAAVVNTGLCATSSSVGERYMAVADAFVGPKESICRPDWGALLQNIATNAVAGAAFVALSAVPVSGSLRAFLDGAELDSSMWSYDPSSNTVLIRTAGGQRIAVSYRTTDCP